MKKPKESQIKIFHEVETSTGTIKKYIHPAGTFLCANVRQLSATEQSTVNATQDQSDIQFTVNYRVLDVAMIIEWKTRFYQIDGVDNYKFEVGADIVLRAHQINTKTYESVEYTDWGA